MLAHSHARKGWWTAPEYNIEVDFSLVHINHGVAVKGLSTVVVAANFLSVDKFILHVDSPKESGNPFPCVVLTVFDYFNFFVLTLLFLTISNQRS